MKNQFTVVLDGKAYPVTADQSTLTINKRPFEIEGIEGDTILVDGIAYQVTLNGSTVTVDEVSHTVEVEGLSMLQRTSAPPKDDGQPADPGQANGDEVIAIMPGKIIRVLVEPGQVVQAGDPICVLEAMKMENELRAPRNSTVAAVLVRPGEAVDKNQRLVTLTPD